MKGHMQDGKFHPHTDYKKGTRKSRDKKVKTQGVRMKRTVTVKMDFNFSDFLRRVHATSQAGLEQWLFEPIGEDYLDTAGNFEEQRDQFEFDVIEFTSQNDGDSVVDEFERIFNKYPKQVKKFMKITSGVTPLESEPVENTVKDVIGDEKIKIKSGSKTPFEIGIINQGRDGIDVSIENVDNGDRFDFSLPQVTTQEDAVLVIERIREDVKTEFDIDSQEVLDRFGYSILLDNLRRDLQ